MRSHPVVGVSFVILGAVLFGLGAFARSAPSFLSHMPLPPEVVVPFILWQLATWALLFGLFFLRPRGGMRERARRAGAAPRF